MDCMPSVVASTTAPPPVVLPSCGYNRLDWPALRTRLGLTRRQSDVVQLIVEESLTSAAIGRRLFIAERTVTTHITAVHKQLGVPCRAAVVSKVWSTWLKMINEGNVPGPSSD